MGTRRIGLQTKNRVKLEADADTENEPDCVKEPVKFIVTGPAIMATTGSAAFCEHWSARTLASNALICVADQCCTSDTLTTPAFVRSD